MATQPAKVDDGTCRCGPKMRSQWDAQRAAFYCLACGRWIVGTCPLKDGKMHCSWCRGRPEVAIK